MKCEDCCHAEMCKWIDELEGRGCDFGELCEDAISRKKAICVISACDGKSAQIESLEQLPSVTPSILKARWIKVTNGRGGHECSNCCEYAPSYKNGEEYLCRFCPDCGAEMEV